ncbi:MAG TPA: polysaccharide biosynthesis tyrosine autokinase [Edaphobacter sp.]|nr:polysaccharide biosynthesis tyrosine autokinase [Edaphobacter sp.]
MEDDFQIARRQFKPPTITAASDLWSVPYPSHGAAEPNRPAVRWWAVARRHRAAILVILLLCIVSSFVVTLLSAPVFKSKALLEVMAVNQEFLNNKDIDPNVSSVAPDAFVETQTKLLMSETVADRTATVLLPIASNVDDQGGIAKLRRWLHLAPTEPESPESIVGGMLRRTKVKAEGQSSLISVTVTGPSAKLVAAAANALAEQDIAELQEARWSSATKTGEFLTKQLDGMRIKLQKSENELQDYARRVGLVYTSDASHESVAQDKLRQIQQDLQKAETDSVDKQTQLELIDSGAPDSLPRVLDDGSLRANKDKVTDLRRQLAELRTTLTPNHYKVKQIESQIAELQAETIRERAAVVKRIQNDYRASSRRQALLSKAYDQQLALVSQQSALEVRYNMLKREVDANRDLYQAMLQKVREAGVLAALRASNMRIVDRAKVPSSPYQPNVVLNLGIGLLAGCMLSVLFILLRERSDQSIRTPGESVKFLDVPELATIPSGKFDIQGRLSAAMTRGDGSARGSFTAHSHLNLPASGKNKMSDLWGQGESLVAESFRSAVTSILLWSRRKGGHRMIVVTSAHAKAGKTTSVFNLGLRLAESGHRVLLIDGDLRRPILGPLFGLDGALGLGDILAEDFSMSVVQEMIRDTVFPGLFVLPGGAPRSNVAQLLHSPRLDALLKNVREDFAFVLIDSPPMIPMTDARLLGQHADGAILICRAGQTSMDQLMGVRNSLYLDGTDVIGTILNDWDARGEDPSYTKSYSRYYRPAESS